MQDEYKKENMTQPVQGVDIAGDENLRQQAKLEAQRGQQIELPKQTAQVQAQPQQATTQPTGRQSYVEQYKARNTNPTKSPEDEEKEKKKQKREQLWAAISDGISSLSNLYFTTQYAPSTYTPGQKTQSERVKERYKQLNDEYEAKKKEYYAGLTKAQAADDQWNLTYQELKAKQAAAKAKQEAAAQAAEDNRRKADAAADKDTAIKNYYDAKTKTESDLLPYRQDESQSRTNKNNRQGTSAWHSGSRSGGGSGSRRVLTFTYPDNAKEHAGETIKVNASEYNALNRTYHPQSSTQEVTEKDAYGQTKTRKITKQQQANSGVLRQKTSGLEDKY